MGFVGVWDVGRGYRFSLLQIAPLGDAVIGPIQNDWRLRRAVGAGQQNLKAVVVELFVCIRIRSLLIVGGSTIVLLERLVGFKGHATKESCRHVLDNCTNPSTKYSLC
jgi:hypothetical protein